LLCSTSSDVHSIIYYYYYIFTFIFITFIIIVIIILLLFNSFFGEQGFDKVRESSRTLKLFESFDVQFWETGPWAPTFKISQLYVYK